MGKAALLILAAAMTVQLSDTTDITSGWVRWIGAAQRSDENKQVHYLAEENNDHEVIKMLKQKVRILTQDISNLKDNDKAQESHINNVKDMIHDRCGGSYNLYKNGICYAYVDLIRTWASAQSYCADIGGYLAEPKTKEQNSYIKSISHGKFVWLGATDIVSENVFRWSTSGGSDLLAENTYSNWYPGEPNNQGGNEDCMHMMTKGQWNDLPCDQTYYHMRFVCQRYANNIVN